MFRKVLIANRGAIACRIGRTLRRMGVGSVAVYSDADRHSLHVRQADEAVRIGPPPAAQSYLCVPALLDAARQTGAEAIHPGYGFLSENADFAEQCERVGIVFIGPTPSQMRDFGLKHTARQLAGESGLPMLPGTGLLAGLDEAESAACRIGFPVMLKSSAGGGGIGMRICRTPDELAAAFEGVQRLSQASFGTGGLFLEKFVANARHIEVQIFGDGAGTVVALGERDCSAQRRHQKVIEETPALGLTEGVRGRLLEAAVRLGSAVRYRSAGTVEFLYDGDKGEFYFLEVNTRLQVEHGVTEEVTGIDLVEWMVRLAAGKVPPLGEIPIRREGCSIQVRIYAEDPFQNFQPVSGQVTRLRWPKETRVETWIEPGSEITPYYDPMLAKLIVKGADRPAAMARLSSALGECEIAGMETNLRYLRQVCASPAFFKGGITTAFLADFPYRRRAIEVIEPGTQTTVQDYPGRLGYWHVGVPPSGPMDSKAFRLANQMVGNPDSAAALEMTVMGPTLKFDFDGVIALTGAGCKTMRVSAGDVVAVGPVPGRGYLAVSGGFDVPEYLGSKSTFILGKFGGHAGRTLRAGDVLHVGENCSLAEDGQAGGLPYQDTWEIGVMYGPHGAPDFFTPEDIEMFFSTAWKVHHHSDRTGIRLIGPQPKWARPDGGEAGLHPSNIHDNAYAVGTIDFTGDMPVILGPDGPSLGGFVCPATIVHDELWKIGRLKPGDLVRFRPITYEGKPGREEPILRANPVCRAAGDRYLLIEYGPNVLDLNLRFRVHALERELRRASLPGIIDITPGVRSLQIHFTGPREELLEAIDVCEKRIPDLDDITVPSRVVRLPLSWDDPATQLAIRKYMQSVRPDAPWCPSNIEFIRRINGLGSVDDVHRIVYSADYLVLGLGDVYLGAPVATPIDPRQRLVTTKYNPARTWTPENAVGIGGAYLCVYGMEGPGGYQFVGRTVQMWNTYRGSPPWLLRFFDRVRFYPVNADELLEIRESFPHGRYPLRIEEEDFCLRDYHAFLARIEPEAAQAKRRQQAAFEAERERWAAAGAVEFFETRDDSAEAVATVAVPDGCHPVCSPVTASVWNVAVEPGQRVEAGQKLVVLEAMKMEIAIAAPGAGVVEMLNCRTGALVTAGQRLVTLRQEVA